MAERSLRSYAIVSGVLLLLLLGAGIGCRANLPGKGSKTESHWYVAPQGSDRRSCRRPELPCRSVQAAVDKAAPGHTVHIESGSYPESVVVKKDLYLKGAGSEAAVIDGQNTHRPLTILESQLRVTGLALKDGRAKVDGGCLLNSGGEVSLEDVTLEGCLAGRGGGAINSGRLVMVNTRLVNNRAGAAYQGDSYIAQGGGIFNTIGGVVHIQRTLFRSNSFQDPYAVENAGSVIFNQGELTLESSTVEDNGFLSTAIVNRNGVLVVRDSQIQANQSNLILHSTGLSPQPSSSSLSVIGSEITGNENALAVDVRDSVLTLEDSRLDNKGGGLELRNSRARLRGVTIEGSDPMHSARDVGGGIKSWESTLSIADSVIRGNMSVDYGGGIRFINRGDRPVKLTIRDSMIRDNQAGFDLSPRPQASDVLGGGIYALGGEVHIQDTTIAGNEADRGGGVAVWDNLESSNTVLIEGSTISGNRARQTAYRGGGGLFIRVPVLHLKDSQVTGNRSEGVGGGLHIQNGEVDILRTLISENQAPAGGGIFLGNLSQPKTLALRVKVSTLKRNFATANAGPGGGGILHRSNRMTVQESAVIDNVSASSGGGIAVQPFPESAFPSAALQNVTLSGNQAQVGGGISAAGDLSLRHVTLAGNHARNEGGGVDYQPLQQAQFTLENSILAENTAEKAGSRNCRTPVPQSGGVNLEDGDSCGFDGKMGQVNTDPLLRSLGDYGGETLSRTLRSSSPAIDAAARDSCLSEDQRGIQRPQGKGCDLGAVEIEGP